ncbi:MAG: hypothetical protein GW779_02150 [Candidatus Altiarchaeum hamiconexum]|uniref:Uncharacterized protein n=1 Tax=Candidatus Altarchaeum hamiconexum TaxID=1803513 RepID=A0A8J7YWF3_9ARCH|nr:hypothetical protein [Candidatus Altarchaeum hamiconexum]OIQ04987.1 MAG: hypothetical protein AUK59_05595 [Candidatus Altarchaeum sp. CG2_30_32_3053]PIN67531.1 MAG: hypothetical protein COV98_02525 [Candidatus Altarchaeum sp. CG12_big_fil_rev_8_21_14_0_65_33_22]PIV28997.1 MAG: hypothetical protein COS36_00140 [Candidatus Altarchaeum sp. CG03_land_8_20_14_0_80_32_618]PIX49439.1 MAG: hypothetical protein COZ53_00605 [Candidatus Altarchaeum sp. CG_4_8_14_3_um_filter_33_2054]PIZ32081.1 MAG: hyp
MVKNYNQGIKKILVYSVLLAITTLIYLYFEKFWEFMSKISFLNVNIVIPITNFVTSKGEGIIITALLSVGLIIAVILLYLIARQILKIIGEKNKV